MARKKKHEEHANHERWLVSYADFITLLFAFFTVLYATKDSSPAKMKEIEASIESAFQGGLPTAILQWLALGGKGELDTSPLAHDAVADPEAVTLRKTLDGSLTDHTVQIGFVEQDLRLVPRNRHLFPPGSAELHPAAFDWLSRIGEAIAQGTADLEVVGHADAAAIPPGSRFEDNWDLAAARSAAAARYLVGKGLPPDRIGAIARVTDGVDPDARALTVTIRFHDRHEAAEAAASASLHGLL